MTRFNKGEEVLVSRFMGKEWYPLRPAVVQELYGTGSSVFDYVVLVAGKRYPVRDGWLVPVDTTISEDFEAEDLI